MSTRLFTDQKWGTQKPVLMRDKEFGMIRMSAFGVFAFRVVAPEVFMREIFGTLSSYSTADITGYLRRILVSGLSDTIGESGIAAIDIVNSYDELAAAAKEKLEPAFAPLGLSCRAWSSKTSPCPRRSKRPSTNAPPWGCSATWATTPAIRPPRPSGISLRTRAAAWLESASAWEPALRWVRCSLVR